MTSTAVATAGSGRKVAIMQPYFLPYIGYFQLINCVDRFVVYDNIKYTKKGWINRNRFLQNGSDAVFSLPLKKGADHLEVVQRELAADFDRDKLLNQIRGAYRKAPEFDATFELLEEVIRQPHSNLFDYLVASIRIVCGHIGIDTPIVVSSTVPADHGLHAQDKVIAICEALDADTYVNPIGGTSLYSSEAFHDRGMQLRFLRSRDIHYRQFGQPSVPWLSIVDVLMFNPAAQVRRLLDEYDLVMT